MADTVRIEELRRRVQTDPASIAFAALAEEYRRAGHFDDAIATCRTGLQRHPAYLSARVTLGRSLLETGRYEEARQELEQVLRSAPENLAAIRALAEIHHRAGELPESEHHLYETEAQPPEDAPATAPQEPPAATASSVPLSVVPAAAAPPSLADSAPPIVTPAATPIQLQAAIPLAPAPARPAAPPPIAVSPGVPAAPMVAAPASRQESPARTATSATALALSPVAAPRPSHPDEVALPALEAFLSAIVAVRASETRVAR